MSWKEYADLWLAKHFGAPRDLDKWEAAKYVSALHEWHEADSNRRKQLEQEVDDGRTTGS